jgi:hypothetical protein
MTVNIFYACIISRLTNRRLLVLTGFFGLGLLLIFAHFHKSGPELGISERTFIGGFFSYWLVLLPGRGALRIAYEASLEICC